MIIQANIGETPTKFQLPDGATPADIDEVIKHYTQTQSPMEGAFKDIWSDTKEAAGDAVKSTVQAVSEPLNNPNAEGMMAVPDAIVRSVGKVGNLIGGATSLAFSPVTGALTASVANSGIIPAAAGAIKRYLVPDDPRFSADIPPEAQHEVAKGIGGGLSTAVGLAMAANQGAKIANRPKPLTVDDLNAAAPNAYKAVADSNSATLSPNVTGKALKIMDDAKIQPIAGKVLTSEAQAVNKALGEYDPLQGSPLTLDDFQKLDKSLGQKKIQAWVSGNAYLGRILAGVQSKIRGLVQPDALSPADVAGSPEGFNILANDAVPLWAAKSKIEDITDMVDAANRTPNPSTAMRTGFSNMMKDGSFKSYPPEVQRLISKAAVTGTADDVLGILGSRLNAIAGQAVGGAPGAVVSNVTSMGFRGMRNALKNNQADAVINQMLENVRPSIEKYQNYTSPPTPPSAPAAPLLRLPAPKSIVEVDAQGNAIPLTPAGREALGKSPSTAAERQPGAGLPTRH